jgi:hypothetical protein
VINQEWAWQNTGAVSMQDMALLETRQWNLRQICRALNVHPMFLFEEESSNQTESGKKVTRRQFMEGTVIPMGKKFEGAFDKFYRRYSRSLRGRFLFHKTEALRDDLETKATILSTLVKSGVSLNDALAFLELDIERQIWGDDYFLPMNMTTAQDVVDGTVKVPERPGQSAIDVSHVDDTIDNGAGNTTKKQIAMTSALMSRWSMEAEAIDDLVEKHKGKVGKTIMNFRSSVLKSMSRGDGDIIEGVGGTDLAESMMPIVIESYVTGLGCEMGDREAVLAAANYSNSRFAPLTEFGSYLRVSIPKMVNEARLSGEPGDDSRVIRQFFNRLSRRVSVVLRLEAFRAANHARYSVLRGTEIMWLCSPHTGCGHASVEGEVVTAGHEFSNGMKHPAEGAGAGCECLIADQGRKHL